MIQLTPNVRAFLGLDEPADDPLMPGAVPQPAYDPYQDGYSPGVPINPAPVAAPFQQPAPAPPPSLTYNDPTAPELYPSVPPASRQRPASVPPASRDVPTSTPVQNALNLLADPGDTGVQHGPAYLPPTQAEAEEDARSASQRPLPAGQPDMRTWGERAVAGARAVVDRELAPAVAAGQAVHEAIRPPRTVGEAVERLPLLVPGVGQAMLYQQALDAATSVIGRRAWRQSGRPDREIFEILGIPVTEEDLAAFAAGVLLDPTNYMGGPAVAKGARGLVDRGLHAGQNLVGRAIAGGGVGLATGLATGQDAATTGRLTVGGAALAAGAPLAAPVVKPVARAAGRALEPLGRELGEQMLARMPRMIQETGGGLPPRPLELGERVESALEVVRAVGRRLDEVEEAARRAEDTGTADEIRVANRAYDAVRAQFDEASRALEDARTAVRAHDATLAEAGYGRPVEEADLLARESDLAAGDRQVPDVPRTVDDAPRGGSVVLNGVLGGVPDNAPRRFYHGTAGAFGRPDPGRFDPNGLFGPGYYLTDSPVVASSYASAAGPQMTDDAFEALATRVAALRESVARKGPSSADAFRLRNAEQNLTNEATKRQNGPNVRAVDVPSGLRLLDADAPVSETDLRAIFQADLLNPLGTEEEARFVERKVRESTGLTGAELFQRLGVNRTNEALRAAGFDGIRHRGGQRVPMMDSDGRPIEHGVTVVFGESLDKITNAFSGEVGGGMLGAPSDMTRMGTDLGATGGTGPLGSVNRFLGTRIIDATGGAVIGAATDPEDPRRGAQRGALVGLAGGPLARRGLGSVARRAGAQGADTAGSRALATLGGVPSGGQGGGGFNWSKFPGVQRAIQASQQRAARMAANSNGPQALNPLQWTMEYAKSVGYSSMIGLRTATVNLVGNVGEPAWAGPKELTRAVLPTMLGGRGHPNEALAWLRGNAKGAQNVPGEALDALLARGHYTTNPDQPRLSERTINPIAHAAALIPELGGRIFSGLPDAIFGSMARGAGEEMAAVRIANAAGLKGPALKQQVAQILTDKQAILAGSPPSDAARLADAQRVLRDGQSYSNDMTYRNDLGTVGEKLKSAATLGNTPILGTTATPFFTTPHNMNLRMLERTPIGLGMNTVNRPGTMRTNFDRFYDATVGSAILAGLALTIGQSGRITGSGPDDPEKRKMLEATGWRPYSILVPAPDGKEYYIPLRYIGPYGKPLSMIGEYRDAQVYRKPGAEIGIDYVKRFGKLLQDDVYASGLTELVHLLDKPEQFLPGFAASQLSRLTPYGASMRDIATSQDPIERQPQSAQDAGFWGNIGQRWQQSTGIGRQELDPKTNVRGEPVENESQGWRAFVPKASQASSDPVLSTLLDHNADLGKPRESFTFTAAGADAPDGGVGTAAVRLTPAERAEWQRYRWQVIEEQLYPAILADPEYQAAPRSVKGLIWSRQMANANRYADGMLKAQIGDADLERRIQEAFAKLRMAS